MRPATHPHVGHRGLAATRDGYDMVEFNAGALLTPMTQIAHERTASAIALPDRAAYFGRDVARVRAAEGGALERGLRELPALELIHESIERKREHPRHITRGHGVSQQNLRVAELIVR